MTSPITGATTRYENGQPVGVDYTYDPAGPSAALSSNLLTTGEATMNREFITSSAVAVANQSLRLSYFTARKTETTTQVKSVTGGTAAGATPTLCRIGLYLIAADGGGTLVASTANDTTLWAATSTAYTRPWSVPYLKVAGSRYAVGVLVVSAATFPTFLGQQPANSPEYLEPPTLSASISGQANLPASFTSASLLSSFGHRAYSVVLP